MAETVTPECLAAQQRQTLDQLVAVRTGMGGMHDDLMVLTAIVTRQENTMKAVLEQLRTMTTTQQNRLSDRLLQLETQRGG